MGTSDTQRVYGPVSSRRLGRSLGVDVIPAKTCQMNCAYCQLGKTPPGGYTSTRRMFFDPDEVVRLVLQRAKETSPDHVTIGGSGEPTLYAGLGTLIRRLRDELEVPARIAVLTNGLLLGRGDVRQDLAFAHVVLPSLDAGTERTFRRINRPLPGFTLERLVQDLADFRAHFDGELWVEVMLMPGLNDSLEEVRAIARLVRRIRPHRVHLNTPTRPAGTARLRTVPHERLLELCQEFEPRAEAIAARQPRDQQGSAEVRPDDILAILARRPCTAADIAAGTHAPIGEVKRLLEDMAVRGAVDAVHADDETYYCLRGKSLRQALGEEEFTL